MDGSGAQAAPRRHRMIHGVEPPQPLTLSAPPKTTDLWEQSDIISRLTYVSVQSHSLPQASSQSPRGAGRQTLPGPGGLWEVVLGK